MKLELVKEYNKLGEVSYFVREDGKYVGGSARQYLTEATEIFSAIAKNYTEAREEVLMAIEI